MKNPLFSLGRIVATPGALEDLDGARVEAATLLDRHVTGDWGDLDAEDRAMNDRAVESGEDRVFSKYTLSTGATLYVITEHDRSSTCLLRPEDY